MSATHDRERYVRAMIAGHINVCITIEKQYELFGYTPELVCIGLSAAAEGKDPHQAIDAYTAALGAQTERDDDPLSCTACGWSGSNIAPAVECPNCGAESVVRRDGSSLIDDGQCRSCVDDKCLTGPECVTLGRDSAALDDAQAEQAKGGE